MAKGKPAEKPRCSGQRSDGSPCRSHVVRGSDRCIRHGGRKGTLGAPLAQVPMAATVTHGNSSIYFRHLGEEGRKYLSELATRPDLYDMRRQVAASTYLLDEVMLDPSPDQVRRAALRLFPALVQTGREPNAHEIVEARLALVERQHRVLSAHAKLLGDANKASKADEIMNASILPALQGLGGRLLRLARAYIPPERREEYKRDLKQTVLVAIGEMSKAMDETK